MRISRLTLPTLIGALFLSSTLALHDKTLDVVANNNAIENKKRDLIGGLFNNQPSQSSPASVPASTSTPTQPTNNLGSPSATSDPTNTGTTAQSLPSLISDVLNPSPVANSTGTAATAAASLNPKRKPKSGASSSVNTSNDNTDSNINGTSIYPANKAQDETQSSELAPGLIAVMIILVLAILAAIAICCYKIRQSQRRRRESWSEDILKNHAGSLGYSKGAGYGMYVGDGGFGKEKPDLWRKNLDLFHRE